MNNKTEIAQDNSKTEPPADQTEMTENELEQVSGGLIALLLPAVQKVREAATVQMGDGSVMPVAKK